MINTYILLNRKTKPIIQIFLINMLILMFLMIMVICNFHFTSYCFIKGKMVLNDNIFLLKIQVSEDELDIINKNNSLIINNRLYNYQVYKAPPRAKNDEIYLKIFNLEDYYLKENYSINFKVIKYKKVLIDYLKKEE